MKLPKASTIVFTSDLHICRLLNEMWQVSEARSKQIFIHFRAFFRRQSDMLDSN